MTWLTAILRGLASIASWGATETARLPRAAIPPYPFASDAEAIASDWRTVGNDLRAAMETEFERERGNLQRAIHAGTVSDADFRRLADAYDQYLDSRTGPRRKRKAAAGG